MNFWNDKLKYNKYEINRGAITDIYDLELNVSEKDSKKVVFSYGEFKKEIVFTETGFEINYIVPEKSEELTVKTEVSPDYYSILNKGKKALTINQNNSGIEIYNTVSNIGVRFDFSEEGKSSISDSLHGYIISNKFKDKKPVIKIEKYFN